MDYANDVKCSSVMSKLSASAMKYRPARVFSFISEAVKLALLGNRVRMSLKVVMIRSLNWAWFYQVVGVDDRKRRHCFHDL